jgi:glycosyltransferase involved in cell wall biosynthesis
MVGSESGRLQLSVLMPTYNRAETMRETLRHLAEQELDPAVYEVVVIDDGSTDDTRAVVEEWVPRALFRLRYIYQSNHGPGHAYNRALEAAEAPIVLYSADDMFLPPQTLRAHLEMHIAHPEEEVAALGAIALSPTLDQSVFLRKFDRVGIGHFVAGKEVPYYNFWACNVSAKRKFVLDHGRMWEGVGPGGAVAYQDPELGYQLSQAGLRILYCRDAVAYHHQIMTLDKACRDAYNRGLNFDEFRERINQPEIAVIYHIWDSSTVGDHLRIWFGPRRHLVRPGDRNPMLLLGRYLLRGLLFNALTVGVFWIPLAERVERSPALARFMRSRFYRGIVTYHFLRGYRKGRTWTRAPVVQPRQA